MIDVTLPDGFPTDLARICQPGAKVYLPKLKEFGVVTKFLDSVDVKLDQGKASSTTSYSREEFLEMLKRDEVVAKSRVILPEDDNKPMKIKPRAKAAAVVTPTVPQHKILDAQGNQVKVDTFGNLVLSPINTPRSEETLLTGYIDEKTGKFSHTLQKGFIEIEYRKVTRKVSLELDSVQLQKLRELGIIE